MSRLRRLLAWYRRPQTQRKLLLLGVVAGGNCLKILWEQTFQRLEDLEGSVAAGTVPLDDVATLADLERVLAERKAAMGPDGRVEEDRPAEGP